MLLSAGSKVSVPVPDEKKTVTAQKQKKFDPTGTKKNDSLTALCFCRHRR
jgi:hypothetical protein